MEDFWRSSGFRLLRRGHSGMLDVTDGFLLAFLHRPELAPVAESCPAERALHASLLDEPRRAVSPAELSALADADMRENYEAMLAFRDVLLAHGTLEGGYLALVGGGNAAVPPLFVDQMVHAMLRGLLDGVDDAFQLRAAELLFRPQKVTIREGAIMVADEETVERVRATGGFGGLGRLVADARTPLRPVDLDILTRERAGEYRGRSDRFDMVLDISFTRPGLDALARVLERWIRHFLGIGVTIHPVQRIRDERWVWHVGLDAGASALLNDLYQGRAVEEVDMRRLLSLFRLEFDDPADMLERVAGRPVYLALCATPDGRLRVKPQNLLLNLPLAAPSRGAGPPGVGSVPGAEPRSGGNPE